MRSAVAVAAFAVCAEEFVDIHLTAKLLLFHLGIPYKLGYRLGSVHMVFKSVLVKALERIRGQGYIGAFHVG